VTDAGVPGIARADITGLVLAGGRGQRMGGVDKGLQPYAGQALALHALQRLAPQVGSVAVNANRHAEAYETFGAPVWPDGTADFAGPLAGFLAGLEHCTTPWLATVPCDAPLFPTDLVTRLAQALVAAGADLAFAATEVAGQRHAQPVFCLMRASLRDQLARDLQSGVRKVEAWVVQQRCVELVFDGARAFDNANTLDELQRLTLPNRT
jgi:molybdopterin-guanine dinucleotide biosynthesis protein A